ncbi:MAG: HD domain-containing protein [Flavobacteriales bacterium]|nr:HD domain-containing protein [Flavobacteriales bacterium]
MDHKGAIEYILNRLEKELPPHLLYHGHHHTIDVLEASERIAKFEDVTQDELNLLLVATAYHDCGFLYGFDEHEKIGCGIAKEVLPKFGFGDNEIEHICEMIMATEVPQKPNGPLAEILCDADLDYLGRPDFEPVAESLFREFKHLGVIEDVKEWNRIQLTFLREHCYHTSYGRTYRQPEKQKHLEKIKEVVYGYDT